jgi:excisionase family DNA binding protein|tara:strand:- start:1775 stop:2038 length:264 start_codon:yes stop_codon:yes gene_type:complete
MVTVYETKSGDTQMVTIVQVAEYLNVSTNTIRNLIKKGQLPFVVVGGTYRFDLNEIKNTLRDNTQENQKNISRRGDLKANEEDITEE